MERFAEKIRDCYRDPLDPLATQFFFRRPPTVGELGRPPQVLLLGNHSSGKSTFVNHLLGAEVQKTGVAPTDDGFTVITYGQTEADRDGPSVVSNPDCPMRACAISATSWSRMSSSSCAPRRCCAPSR
jgi:hypothetical protein